MTVEVELDGMLRRLHLPTVRRLWSELQVRAEEEKMRYADYLRVLTIPEVDYSTAVAIVAEIGDIRRFPTKKHLGSHAGVVPRGDNSGEKVSSHRHVKSGDFVLKRFLCIAVQGMPRARQETAIRRFYEKKAKAIGAQKAQVAAARKLACAIWWMLSHHEAFQDQDDALTVRKAKRMQSVPERPTPEVTAEDLEKVGRALEDRLPTLSRLTTEVANVG